MGHSCSRPEIRSRFRFRFTVSIAIAAASLVIGGALISCVGDDPGDSPGNGTDASSSDGTTTGDGSSSDGSTSGDGGPSNSTLTVAQDQDPTKGNVNETLTIARLANEGSITGYNVYWATSTSTKLTQLTNIPKTGGNVTYTAVGAIPDTATQFLVFGANTDGTESQLAAAQIRDNFPIYIDITQNFDAGVGQYSIAVDQTNHKLDVVYAATVPGVVRCDLNDTTGSSCVYAPMPGTAGAGPGQVAPAVIDATNGKLILVQAYSRAATGSSLYARSCGLTDATGSTCVVPTSPIPLRAPSKIPQPSSTPRVTSSWQRTSARTSTSRAATSAARSAAAFTHKPQMAGMARLRSTRLRRATSLRRALFLTTNPRFSVSTRRTSISIRTSMRVPVNRSIRRRACRSRSTW
jgi:hypothetical protein